MIRIYPVAKELNFKNMQRKYTVWLIFSGAFLVLLLLTALWSLTSGELNIGITDIIPTLQGKPDSMEYMILKQIRIPRMLLGAAVGGALSLSGVILQGVYRNPLVEPYTLGISGGASLGVALVVVTGLHRLIGSFMLPLSGFAGAFLVIFLVYTISSGMVKSIFRVCCLRG
jgi:iron complex transport system permease protein